MSLDLYASSLTTSGNIVSSGTISSTGNHDTSGSYLIKGSTVLTSNSLGTTISKCSLTDTSGSYLKVAGTANTWSLSVGTGSIKPSGVYARMYSTSAGTISDPTSALTGGSSNYDVYPTSTLGSGYGWQDVSGSAFAFQYRAPVNGVYQVCINCRLGDSSSTTYGFKFYKYTGSVLTSMIPGDGYIWLGNDGSNRRCGTYITQILLSQGNGIFPSVGGSSITTSWCEMTVVLLHAT